MPSYLDLGLIIIILVSALLSMVRGFTREVLAIGSWAAAAAAAYFFYPNLVPYVTPYIHKEPLPAVISAAVIFFVALIVVSILTVRISDAILDSKVGALDRSLGFVFGAVRGFLLGVVAFAIFNWLVAEKQQPEWVKNAKTRPILMQTADRVIALLPDDAEHTIEGWWKKTKTAAPADDAPLPPDESNDVKSPDMTAPAAAPPKKTEAPAPTPPAATANTVAPTDKQKLDAILNKPTALPNKPAVLPTPPAKP
ncbi:CvpA family protein [Methylocapsa sp. S129]|uniref:CvpA family protein n=1 Tax=Methylocapsa sp. S129 TaxID=1641869 RepID=UPI00131E92C2|nr:CvpA family protein [Methylocapsa sp. S129]